MNTPLFSSSWYRVADLTPRLKGHAHIHRQMYRGQLWYVLQDYSSERFHRFTPSAYHVINLLDGHRTVQHIWDMAADHLGDEAPTQDQLITLLSQLHSADVLQCDVHPDTEELFRRYLKHHQRQWQGRFFSVFAWKIPLVDPERFLQKFLSWVRPWFSWWGAVIWGTVVIPGVILAGTHWMDLTHNIMDLLLTPQNLFLMWLLFPILKLFHELGHGFAVKAFGGEVHEMGVMFLVFTPVPYVDASSAWSFREKWQRVVVGAAGMIVEVFLASIALFIWLNVEPGLIQTVTYNAMLISGISTVLFNANPLLRFDGYYILSDYLEIPNLRTRANSYLQYLCQRDLFGHRDADPPPSTPGEQRWFVTFGIAAFFYRILVMTAIVLFLMDEVFVVGVILGIFAAITLFVVPLVKGFNFIFTSPIIRKVRTRAILVTCLILLLITTVLTLVPMPSRTMAEGVIWIHDEAHVRAGSAGFVTRLNATPGTPVNPDQILITCEDPVLATEIKVLKGRVKELEAQIRHYWAEEHVKATIVQEELAFTTQELAQAQQQYADLTVRSQIRGTFIVPRSADLPGRYVERGQSLGYVIDPSMISVRAVIPQTAVDRVRHHTVRVEARLSEQLGARHIATMTRVVPSATEELPSPALGIEGGGTIPIDPTAEQHTTAAYSLFHMDLDLPMKGSMVNRGGRVYLKFVHDWEPLATQWARHIRQLFLSRFTV